MGRQAQFDYVVMDEASQVDVATGMLALSCAKKAVIVGDTKQLSNIVKTQQRKPLETIWNAHKISAEYNFAEYSFLSSLCSLMSERIPQVVFRTRVFLHCPLRRTSTRALFFSC